MPTDGTEVNMLVSEDSRRSRPIVLYGILAKSALNQLEHPRHDLDQSAFFQNLVRLLDLYLNNALHKPVPKAVLDRRTADPRGIRRIKQEADAVQSAIAIAHEAVFPGMPKEEVVARLQAIFSRIAQREISQIPTDDVGQAKAFLIELSKALKK
jgi:hypothetical protein